jgi:hypothetical protein
VNFTLLWNAKDSTTRNFVHKIYKLPPIVQMSGIEVLGLVLAIVPLFITPIEKYEHGYGILAEWVEFRREYGDFSNRLRFQRIRLRQLAETTLRSVTESEAAMQTMLENPKSEKWKDPAITERLKYKLSGKGEYEAYSTGIVNVYERLKEIEKCLNVHNLPVSSFRSKTMSGC